MQELATLWVRKLHFTGEFSTALSGIKNPSEPYGHGVLEGAKGGKA
jgi:hypothetical protein